MRFVFDLPWPPPQLSPNARIHHMIRHRIGKHYKNVCHVIARNVLVQSSYQSMQLRQHVEDGDKIHLILDFYPPNRRRRDDDNLVAAFKAGRDGVAAALMIDDRHFITHSQLKDAEPVSRGLVRATVTTRTPGVLDDVCAEV